ncbi:AAA family ATPase [Pseudomarimonas arenosa]|uniref:AAA family ATPase n=1 Tax=Pseudomarimonas arenosa TaxID=2774145 RepID=A0AAW3ZSA3_9GAMM|nr:ATP-binding protein [Pseudomarimonas arenosa]MBD8527096.1 AAA family ATPase [Pseudomarimonas arenosa]
MPLAADAPGWAKELALGFESGAHGQFVLHGNVADRFLLQGRRVSLVRCLDALLLGGFQLVFSYDLGNGLAIVRGGERLTEWPPMKEVPNLPRDPRGAIELITRYMRFRANLSAMGRGEVEQVAVIVRGADQVLPASRSGDIEIASLASLVRDWASEPPFAELPFASFLIADNLADLHPLVANHPRVDKVRIPLPDAAELAQALAQLRVEHAAAFDPASGDEQAAAALTGVTLSSLQSLVRIRAHQQKRLGPSDWAEVKKQLIEDEAEGLIEFIESKRSLDDYHAQDALKTWLRQDIALWHGGDLLALPMGYIFCGPVGTGKTYLVECLAGEAHVPVVKLKNFRDRWVGSSEGNLEKIFRLIRALGRCMVFIDEADQTLGKRDAGSGDSGLSGRLYSMIAQEMSNSANRGRVMWVLASSRPDLIEVDLKRPGRVDVKVPLLPTTTVEESAGLLRALLKRFDIKLEVAELAALPLPTLLTPGAAEALAVKVYRHSRTQQSDPLKALSAALEGYQAPVPRDVLEYQMRIAIREATDMAFVPPSLRALGDKALP